MFFFCFFSFCFCFFSSRRRHTRCSRDWSSDVCSSDLVRTVVYLRDINDAAPVAKAHSEVFDAIRPASSLIQVDSMLRPWQKVEIETYAIVAD